MLPGSGSSSPTRAELFLFFFVGLVVNSSSPQSRGATLVVVEEGAVEVEVVTAEERRVAG